MRKILFVILIFSLFNTLLSQKSAFLYRASVNNSNVLLTWKLPVDTNAFSSYEIQRFDGISFITISNITNINTLTFTDLPPFPQNPNTSSIAYRVVVKDTSNNQYISNQLSTIYLVAVPLGNGNLNLVWNNLMTTVNINMNSWYRLYVESPIGTWSLIDSFYIGTTQNTFEIKVCNDSMTFKIENSNGSSINYSNIFGGNYQDTKDPGPIPINYVTVDTSNNNVDIYWNQSTASDAWGYIIIQTKFGNSVPIDTIWDKNITSYKANTDASKFVFCYGISPFDKCMNTTGYVIPQHCSMFLSQNADPCQRKVSLEWIGYNVWGNNVTYEVYEIENGIEKILGTTTDKDFVVNDVNPNIGHCYFIKAKNTSNGLKSLSNKVCISNLYSQSIGKNKIVAASHISNNKVKITILGDTNISSTQTFALLRSFDSITWVQIATNLKSPNSYIEYSDNFNNTINGSIYYKSIMLDTCGNYSKNESNIFKTIYVTVEKDEYNLVNTIKWNHIINNLQNVVRYKVYRVLNNGNIEFLDNLQSIYNSYTDDVSDFYYNGKFCYYIEAELVKDTIYDYSSISFQNCTTLLPTIYTSNVLIVNEKLEDEFKPYMTFGEFQQYKMEIYNRNGELVFSTEDPQKGWNGVFKGKRAKTDVYVYKLNYSTLFIENIETTGSFTLINK